jgi:catechol 2,3-dioxygenase-like lactoylglutathione lyase family enzyme
MTAAIAFNRLVPELLCRDFARSLAFYGETLGFTWLYGREDPPFAYLEFEGAQLMLEQIDRDASWLTAAMTPPFGRGINLQIETGDLDGLLARLAKARVALYREPESAWYRAGDRMVGQRQFLVQDPDGYLLRFCQDLGERELGRIGPGERHVS